VPLAIFYVICEIALFRVDIYVELAKIISKVIIIIIISLLPVLKRKSNTVPGRRGEFQENLVFPANFTTNPEQKDRF
jgi:hypothetical protein